MNCRIFSLAAVLLLAACDQPSSVSPGESVTLSLAGTTGEHVQLRLVNRTLDTLYYWGFSKSSPLKRIEILTDTGWSVLLWDWCATGAEQQAVSPMGAAIIDAPLLQHKTSTRLIMHYSRNYNGELRELKSQEYIIP